MANQLSIVRTRMSSSLYAGMMTTTSTCPSGRFVGTTKYAPGRSSGMTRTGTPTPQARPRHCGAAVRGIELSRPPVQPGCGVVDACGAGATGDAEAVSPYRLG